MPSPRTPADPVRRSELSCPGHSRRMLEHAAASAADLVIMDLEDGCAPDQKVPARAVVAEAARTLDWGTKVLAVRPNGLSSPYFFDDLLEVVAAAGPRLQVVVLPKVGGPDEVRYVDRLLGHLEQRHRRPPGHYRLEVLIESASGVLHAPAIAAASPRLSALLFGTYDFAGDVGLDLGPGSAPALTQARVAVVLAARAHGLQALDGITARFKDLELTRSEAQASRGLGFDGKWAIHPTQVPVINEVFTPTAEELQRSQRALDAYRSTGTDRGLGAIALGGEMVDLATVRADQRRVDLGRRLGLLPPA